MRAGVGAIIQAAEDHFSGWSLVNRSDQNFDGAIDQAPCSVNHNHSAIVQISHALIGLFAFAKDQDAHGFAGKNGRFEGVSEFVDVEHGNALDPGDFIQIVIVGDDFACGAAREIDEFLIDPGTTGRIFFQKSEVGVPGLVPGGALRDPRLF